MGRCVSLASTTRALQATSLLSWALETLLFSNFREQSNQVAFLCKQLVFCNLVSIKFLVSFLVSLTSSFWLQGVSLGPVQYRGFNQALVGFFERFSSLSKPN